MILFYFFVCFLFCFALLLLLACLLISTFKFVLLLSLFWFLFVCFVCLFVFLEGRAVFISIWAGTGQIYNYLLIRKLTFFKFRIVHKFEVWQERFTVIRELFFIIYFKYFLLICCNFSY